MAGDVQGDWSWIELWLPRRRFVNEATVKIEDRGNILNLIDSRDGFLLKVGTVLKAGRSNACSIEEYRGAWVVLRGGFGVFVAWEARRS